MVARGGQRCRTLFGSSHYAGNRAKVTEWHRSRRGVILNGGEAGVRELTSADQTMECAGISRAQAPVLALFAASVWRLS